MKRKHNKKRNYSGPKTKIIHEVEVRDPGVSYTLNELEMRDRVYGPYGSTSFSEFDRQIASVRRMAAVVAHGF